METRNYFKLHNINIISRLLTIRSTVLLAVSRLQFTAIKDSVFTSPPFFWIWPLKSSSRVVVFEWLSIISRSFGIWFQLQLFVNRILSSSIFGGGLTCSCNATYRTQVECGDTAFIYADVLVWFIWDNKKGQFIFCIVGQAYCVLDVSIWINLEAELRRVHSDQLRADVPGASLPWRITNN